MLISRCSRTSTASTSSSVRSLIADPLAPRRPEANGRAVSRPRRARPSRGANTRAGQQRIPPTLAPRVPWSPGTHRAVSRWHSDGWRGCDRGCTPSGLAWSRSVETPMTVRRRRGILSLNLAQEAVEESGPKRLGVHNAHTAPFHGLVVDLGRRASRRARVPVGGGRGLLAGPLRGVSGGWAGGPAGRGRARRVRLAGRSTGCGVGALAAVEVADGGRAGRGRGRGASGAGAAARVRRSWIGPASRRGGACPARVACSYGGGGRSSAVIHPIATAGPAPLDPRSGRDMVLARGSRAAAMVGDYRCRECGYGVTVYRELLRCPMCGATAWEQTPGRLRSRRS
jgi:rubredoxin